MEETRTWDRRNKEQAGYSRDGINLHVMVDKRAEALDLQSISSASRFGKFKIRRQGNDTARQGEHEPVSVYTSRSTKATSIGPVVTKPSCNSSTISVG